MKLTGFKLPSTHVIIFTLICITAILTWIIPGGEYQTHEINGRNAVIPGSFIYIESNPQGPGDVLLAPIRGFVQAALIIGFVLIVGGAFYVLQKTEAVDAAIQSLARAHKNSKILQVFVIPIFMIIFSLAGAIFGMSEEVIPFVLLFIPLAMALGYDSITGVAIPFIGAGAGFAGAFINPFTLGIAQGIAEVPPLSGFEYRVFCWFVVTSVAIIFVHRYANRVKSDPRYSPLFEQDQEKRHQFHLDKKNSDLHLEKKHYSVLIIFAFAMVALVVGVLRWNWFIEEISALFLFMAILVGLTGRLKTEEISSTFIKGAQDLIGTGLIIALARGILVVAEDGRIIDTILNSLSSLVEVFHPIVSSQTMFIIQTVINFFVPSGSGQAALTMPIMAPLSDLVGVSRQTAVLAFQFGDGFSNLIIPTSGVTMGVLALANIPWEKWARWILPLELLFLLTGLLLLIPPYFIRW